MRLRRQSCVPSIASHNDYWGRSSVAKQLFDVQFEFDGRGAGSVFVLLPPERDFAWQADGPLGSRSAVDAGAVEDIPQLSGHTAHSDTDGVIQRCDILCSQVFFGDTNLHAGIGVLLAGEGDGPGEFRLLTTHLTRVLTACFDCVAAT